MKREKGKVSRRSFLKIVGASSVGLMIVPRRILGGKAYASPNEELTRAIIGVGGMGLAHIEYKGGRLLAICDADENRLKKALEKAGPGVKAYKDFREVLAREDIDIVHIVTPPHWHGIMAVESAKAGKDIWCEKPMTRTIGEGKKVVEAVQRYGRIFRINTWFRMKDTFYGFGTTVAQIKKVVDSGMLGWPLRVNVGESTGFTWKFFWSGRTDLEPQPVPPELDYDLWLGPAPYKPYHPHRVHGTFRGYWDYDGGGLGDMGQHYLDPVQYLLGKDDTSPVEVEVDAPPQHPDAVSYFRWIRLKYADGCEIFLDGEGRPNMPYIEGPKGKLYPGLKSDIPNFERKLASLPDPEPLETDFIKCVKTRQKFPLNEVNAHRSCILVNLAKIAMQLGRSLKFDPEKQMFIDDEEANRLIDPPMRAPWNILI
ncbi:MAG: Gfo/Idh/MocA family oxidoreductase [Candidatus Hydrogenedentes bacterium]|nr:Gfo/Idh/MocA family oxidoreductase [Candidatus Hydrogenedentota bacterium]